MAMYSIHRIITGDTSSVSISALTAYENHFIKLRYTTDEEDVDKAKFALGSFLRVFRKTNLNAAAVIAAPVQNNN